MCCLKAPRITPKADQTSLLRWHISSWAMQINWKTNIFRHPNSLGWATTPAWCWGNRMLFTDELLHHNPLSIPILWMNFLQYWQTTSHPGVHGECSDARLIPGYFQILGATSKPSNCSHATKEAGASPALAGHYVEAEGHSSLLQLWHLPVSN